MLRFKLLFVFIFVLAPVITPAQAQPLLEDESLYAIVKDIQGNRFEGYLLYPDIITVSTKDNQEKSIPLTIVESIKVEKIQEGIPGADKLAGESYYSVRLKNSQEIFTLQKRYSFSLNTSVGMVTKTIDPETVKNVLGKDSSLAAKPESNQPFIRDKSVILSLEIKF